MLEITDSVMTYRRRYFAEPQWPGVLDLLLSDESNPRSLAFQVAALAQHASQLPREGTASGLDLPARQINALADSLRDSDWQSLAERSSLAVLEHAESLLEQSTDSLRSISDCITHLYFSHAETRAS